jgi:8-oxo-dGTP pyrophosphatase MutT (NUDIX family)
VILGNVHLNERIFVIPQTIDLFRSMSMKNENHNPWQTKSSEIRYDNPWIQIQHNEVINPAGNPGIYGVVHFKNLAIGIIPLDEHNNTWIVGQYRYATNSYSWEIPEGGGKLDTDPIVSAQRELLEECGIIANRWEKILEMDLSNSATNEHAILYVARDLQFTHAEPEETEDLQLKKVPFETLYQMVMNGEVQDAMSVAAVLKLKLMLGS